MRFVIFVLLVLLCILLVMAYALCVIAHDAAMTIMIILIKIFLPLFLFIDVKAFFNIYIFIFLSF